MGKVFLAEHPVIGRKAALKVIHPQFARNADVVARFVNEARAVTQIGHAHIVEVTDFGHTDAGDFYFIMEYLDGHKLSDRDRAEPFSPARATSIAVQIADALEASHQQGVIHRDLKPDNILLVARDDTPDFVKVFDFGLAKLTHKSPRGAGGRHGDRDRDGHALLHVARAVRRPARARPPRRHLRAGGHPVPDADRSPPVQRRGVRRGDGATSDDPRAAGAGARARGPARAGGDRRPRAGQGSRGALPDHGRAAPGAAGRRAWGRGERPGAAAGRGRRDADARAAGPAAHPRP